MPISFMLSLLQSLSLYTFKYATQHQTAVWCCLYVIWLGYRERWQRVHFESSWCLHVMSIITDLLHRMLASLDSSCCLHQIHFFHVGFVAFLCSPSSSSLPVCFNARPCGTADLLSLIPLSLCKASLLWCIIAMSSCSEQISPAYFFLVVTDLWLKLHPSILVFL